MKKAQFTLLVLLLLVSQGFWLDHCYYEHDQGEVCEVCLTAHSQDHTLAPALLSLSINQTLSGVQAVPSAGLVGLTTGHCLIRAPPSTS